MLSTSHQGGTAMGVITVSRQYGAGAQELVEKVSSRMGYRIVDRVEIQKKLIEIADRKSTRLNSSHSQQSRMPSSA